MTGPLVTGVGDTCGVSDLAVMGVVGSEPEAVLVCSILRDAGIPCMHRVTNLGSGRMDGLTIGGPREIVVHRDQLRLARRVMGEQPDDPGPSTGRAAPVSSPRSQADPGDPVEAAQAQEERILPAPR